jgi:RNA polymerase sigma factor (sigma-70 family)
MAKNQLGECLGETKQINLNRDLDRRIKLCQSILYGNKVNIRQMVSLQREIKQPQPISRDNEEIPESAILAEQKIDEDLEYLKELVNEAVDFILECTADLDDVTEDKEEQEIIDETRAKLRFLESFYDFQVSKELKGELADFVETNKESYPKPSIPNALTNEIFGCNFNTVVKSITAPKKVLELSDEEAELWEKVRRGDVEAMNTVLEKNYGLIKKIISQRYGEYVISGKFNYQDLFDEGVIGLRKAIDKYNPKFGNRFSTFAYQWIRDSVSKYVSQNSNVLHYPVPYVNDMQCAKKMIFDFKGQNGRNPSDSEFRKMFNDREVKRRVRDPELILRSITLERRIAHLDAFVGHDGARSLHSVIGTDPTQFDELAEYDLNEKLKNAIVEHIYSFNFKKVRMPSLDPDLALHIIMRYFYEEGVTLENIAQCWGDRERSGKPYSIERIRQIKKAILDSFKESPEITELLLEI